MNKKHNKLLHYVLIILLMFAPVRGVLAVQQSHCDMDDMSMNSMSMSTMMQSHDMDAMSSADLSVDGLADMSAGKNTDKHQSCCCDGDCQAACMGSCDINISASLLIQNSTYHQAFAKSTSSSGFSSEIIIRALAPPSRPPAQLS